MLGHRSTLKYMRVQSPIQKPSRSPPLLLGVIQRYIITVNHFIIPQLQDPPVLLLPLLSRLSAPVPAQCDFCSFFQLPGSALVLPLSPKKRPLSSVKVKPHFSRLVL